MEYYVESFKNVTGTEIFFLDMLQEQRCYAPLAHDSLQGLSCNYLAQFQPTGEGQDCNSIFAEKTCYFSQSRVRVRTSPNRRPFPVPKP